MDLTSCTSTLNFTWYLHFWKFLAPDLVKNAWHKLFFDFIFFWNLTTSSSMFLNSATLECKLVPQGVIKQLPNLCKVHAGLLHGHESALSFFQLQSAAKKWRFHLITFKKQCSMWKRRIYQLGAREKCRRSKLLGPRKEYIHWCHIFYSQHTICHVINFIQKIR